jgi:hypothetical protein
MAAQELIIKNIDDFKDYNKIKEIEEKINNGNIKSIKKLYELIDVYAINKDNANNIIEELTIENLKIIKAINDHKTKKIVIDSLPGDCKIEDPEVKNIEFDGDDKLNELIQLINTKFNIINKIL